MITYAIKIENEYFKAFKYAEKNTEGRYAGYTGIGNLIKEGDIIGIETSKEIKRSFTKRGVGGQITCICGIEEIRNKKVEITLVPVEKK